MRETCPSESQSSNWMLGEAEEAQSMSNVDINTSLIQFIGKNISV